MVYSFEGSWKQQQPDLQSNLLNSVLIGAEAVGGELYRLVCGFLPLTEMLLYVGAVIVY